MTVFTFLRMTVYAFLRMTVYMFLRMIVVILSEAKNLISIYILSVSYVYYIADTSLAAGSVTLAAACRVVYNIAVEIHGG